MHHIAKDYSTEKGLPLKLHENKFFSVIYNGYYHYVEYNKVGGGAVVIPRFDNGDLLLVRLRRAPVFGFSLEFPRGGVNIGESLKAGALRELSEESGYSLDTDAAHFLGTIGPDTATLNSANHVFLVDIPAGAVQGAYDTEEIEKTLRVSMVGLKQLVKDNSIQDGQTLAALAMLMVRQ